MQLKHVNFIKWAVLSISCCLIIAACLVQFFIQSSYEQAVLSLKTRELPKSSFAFADYHDLAENALHLKYVCPKMRPPDLRSFIVYHGLNARPDAQGDAVKMHFSLQGGKSTAVITPDEKIYLSYDKKLSSPCKYQFSPGNEPTMVWLTAAPEGQEAKIALAIDEGEENFLEFNLPEKEFFRTSGQPAFEVGKWRVDGTLLARQKARWMGVDRFIEKHGGDEFKDIQGSHRVDFGEGDDAYSVFLKASDFLVWDEEKWKKAPLDGSSLDKPLLVVKKIEDRIMMLDLFDVSGKGKVSLTLIRAPDHFRAEEVARDFRFVGARTKTQVVFELDHERVIVKPNDWFLHTEEGWKKLKTAEEIDDYVNRKLIGTLFIFEEILKKEDKSCMIGSLYNPGRTESHLIEVAMIPTSTPTLPLHENPNETKPQVPTPIATH